MKLKDCFDKRLLRRERPDLEKSKRSIEVAEVKPDEAEKALSHKLCDATIILAYTAMFHAARAILFGDGIVEKSHVCLIEYLRETYVNTGKLSEATFGFFLEQNQEFKGRCELIPVHCDIALLL